MNVLRALQRAMSGCFLAIMVTCYLRAGRWLTGVLTAFDSGLRRFRVTV